MTSHPASVLLLLPNALVLSILSFLPLPSLTLSSSLSALFFVLTQDDRLWRPLCIRRWRSLLPYLQQRLMSPREWAAAAGAEYDSAAEEGVEASKAVTGSGGEVVDDGPVFPQDGGWKLRYIACEMDLCRSFLSLSELLGHRWQFRFHFLFDDTTRASYPTFTRSHMSNREDTYNWRWVDRHRGVGQGDGEEPLAYERRRFLTRDAIERMDVKSRRYYLRSTPPPSTASASTSSNVSTPLPLHPTSALLSPHLPPYRYRPAHPFFTLTPLQMEDCRLVRGLQINHFPARTITRMRDGGWHQLNQYVVMIAVHPEAKEEEEDEAEEVEEDQDVGDEEGDNEEEVVGGLAGVGRVNDVAVNQMAQNAALPARPPIRLYHHLHYQPIRPVAGLEDAMEDDS